MTGGAGFIGSNIAEELVRQGKRVRVLDNMSTGKRQHMAGFFDEIEFVQGDIRDLGVCRRAMKDVDYAIHQAAIRSVPKSVDKPTESHEANATGTLHMLIAAREARVKRFVYASTSSAYGDETKFPQKELYKPAPLSPYGASKLCGEHYCILYSKTMGLETVSMRYFNVFGPRQDPESLYSAVIPKFMEQAYQGLPLEVHWDGKQSRDFTHVKNVVAANLLAAKSTKAVGKMVNIANGRSYSLLDIIRVLEQIVGHKLERRHHPKRQGDVRKTWADITQARKLLGYKPVMGFEPGLRDTWNYFVEHYFKKQDARQPAAV
ncbi:MAG: NAD-dependent epimerase/dehydratase family protein [Elusimicrobia bacterium]|nr:NAD-dependent epimerase/dehydratase family protein [Elusimicrobiota bacterium]